MKSLLRKELLEKRNLLKEKDIYNKSTMIFKKLKDLPFYQQAKNIMLFVSFGSEVLTKEIIDDLLQSKKNAYIPVAVPKTKELIVSQLFNFKNDLEIGHFGILEPKKEALRPVDSSVLDLVIVPGVGFDSRGYRIGYGGGYYDRFLPKLSANVSTAALAFELQVIPKVPNDSYDFAVKYIITETQVIDCNKVSNVEI